MNLDSQKHKKKCLYFGTTKICHLICLSNFRYVRLFGKAVTKIGPWGGFGGMPCDIEMKRPHRLESVTIYSDVVVRSLTFTYTDIKGVQHTERWGGPGGSANTVSEKVLEVHCV